MDTIAAGAAAVWNKLRNNIHFIVYLVPTYATVLKCIQYLKYLTECNSNPREIAVYILPLKSARRA
jgi:hypothetical protein